MDSDDKVMLYLYKHIGLFWERTLSSEDNRDMCSMATNKGLRTFFNEENAIIYNITNAKDMHKKSTQENELYFIDAKSSIIRSLVYHLRNSIMHGLYRIIRKQSKIYIAFEDMQPGNKATTLKGTAELDRLKKMMNIIRNYQRM